MDKDAESQKLATELARAQVENQHLATSVFNNPDEHQDWRNKNFPALSHWQTVAKAGTQQKAWRGKSPMNPSEYKRIDLATVGSALAEKSNNNSVNHTDKYLENQAENPPRKPINHVKNGHINAQPFIPEMRNPAYQPPAPTWVPAADSRPSVMQTAGAQANPNRQDGTQPKLAHGCRDNRAVSPFGSRGTQENPQDDQSDQSNPRPPSGLLPPKDVSTKIFQPKGPPGYDTLKQKARDAQDGQTNQNPTRRNPGPPIRQPSGRNQSNMLRNSDGSSRRDHWPYVCKYYWYGRDNMVTADFGQFPVNMLNLFSGPGKCALKEIEAETNCEVVFLSPGHIPDGAVFASLRITSNSQNRVWAAALECFNRMVDLEADGRDEPGMNSHDWKIAAFMRRVFGDFVDLHTNRLATPGPDAAHAWYPFNSRGNY
ncbi:MAG: hypothetical protein GY696_09820 [Gammaproteobacteria bacterium]|nr:hypothetical protein [Gammaproteobacteria bacterium]